MSHLVDLIKHEHDHLMHFFTDLDKRFYEADSGQIDATFLELARGELELGIEELLHHFDQEEAVLFAEVVSRFPVEKEYVAKLTRMHEFICDQTQDLQIILESNPVELQKKVSDVHDIVSTIRGALRTHAKHENAFFVRIFEDLEPTEVDWFLAELAKI